MRTSAAIPLVLLLGACATAPHSATPASSLLRADWQPAPEQSCQLLTTPSVLPEAHQILDISAARTTLTSAASASHGALPYAVLEVQFDSTGSLQPVRVLENTVPAEVAEALLRTVVSTAPEGVGENGRAWGVLVKATAQVETGTFQVDRMEYCACSLMNRREFTRYLASAVRQVRIPALEGTQQRIIIDVRSDSTGAIVEKRLHQPTGYSELDRVAVQIADQMRVAPPLLNRRPIEMWSRVPITLVFPAAARPTS